MTTLHLMMICPLSIGLLVTSFGIEILVSYCHDTSLLLLLKQLLNGTQAVKIHFREILHICYQSVKRFAVSELSCSSWFALSFGACLVVVSPAHYLLAGGPE